MSLPTVSSLPQNWSDSMFQIHVLPLSPSPFHYQAYLLLISIFQNLCGHMHLDSSLRGCFNSTVSSFGKGSDFSATAQALGPSSFSRCLWPALMPMWNIWNSFPSFLSHLPPPSGNGFPFPFSANSCISDVPSPFYLVPTPRTSSGPRQCPLCWSLPTSPLWRMATYQHVGAYPA